MGAQPAPANIKYMKPNELLREFNRIYGGYICISIDVCEMFVNEVPERLHSVDNLYDYVLSNDLAEEVIE